MPLLSYFFSNLIVQLHAAAHTFYPTHLGKILLIKYLQRFIEWDVMLQQVCIQIFEYILIH